MEHKGAPRKIKSAKRKSANDKAFRTHKVVPDLIDVAPSQKLRVKYLSSNQEVNLGNELAPSDLKEIPEIDYEADPDEYYTLALIDPDIPRRKNPVQKEWQSWLVVNIPGSDIVDGDTLTSYIRPLPPKFTDLHRFVFLVYKQPSPFTFNEPTINSTDAASRFNFSIKEFAKKYNLGNPIAGNFLQAEFDDSVPAQLRKMIFNRN